MNTISTKFKKKSLVMLAVTAVLFGTAAMADNGKKVSVKYGVGAVSSEKLYRTFPVNTRSSNLINRVQIRNTSRNNVGRCKIDPAAKRIEAKILKRTLPDKRTHARVRIKGVVKNRGASYRSNPGQQVAKLYENDRVVAEKAFSNLNSKQEVYVKYDRRWSASTEFPPTYKLVIEYDPDIRMDANPMNDDCRMGNNQKSLRGSVISNLILGSR